MTTLSARPCLTAIGLVLAAGATPALAATTVSTDTTAALATSSAGDVTVTEDGTITLAGGTAITIDSAATVSNAGTITLDDANGAAAIVQRAGTTATIDNSGTISVTEDYVPADSDANSIVDGPIAAASGRSGVIVAGGAASGGTITNSGTITVEGLQSTGIGLLGGYTGTLTNTDDGIVQVFGDYSTAIRTGAVNGDVTINGTVTATGEGARGLAIEGDVSGALVIQGTVQQAISYTTDDSDVLTLSRGDVRVHAPAVVVTGSVGEGISIAAPPLDQSSTSSDEDGDGVTDSDEGTGTIVAYGNGPALLIGGTTNTTIGAVTGNDGTWSLNIEGSVLGNAYYSSTDGYGVVIGGQGGNVTLTDGIGISGSLRAATYDQGATALLINAGSTVNRLYVSGSVVAQILSPGDGTAYGVRDLSGTLTQIENTGFISAKGSSEDLLHAIDLSANTTGVTISQHINTYDAATRASIEDDDETTDTTVYTGIYGDIVTGSGNDTLSASDGVIVGDTWFNAGDDSLQLSGRAAYTGKVHFGSGALAMAMAGNATFTGTVDAAGQAGTLTLADSAVFKGTFTNAANLAVVVNGGTFGAKAAETTSFGSLSVGADGTLGVYIDTDSNTASRFVVGSATFASGSRLAATISTLSGAEGTYTVLSAGSLTGLPTLDADASDLPYVFTGTVSSTGSDIVLTIARKTADHLGLSGAGAAAWNAVFDAADADDSLAQSLLEITDSATLSEQVNQLLPDHAGGVFDLATRGSRLAARHLMDDSSFFDITDVGGWMEPIYWRTSKAAGDTVAYTGSGWGISAGFEQHTALGYLGLSYAYMQGKISNNGGTGQLDVTQNEVGAFWRSGKGPLYAFARLGAARLGVDSTRTFTGTISDADFTYTSTGAWHGWLVSAMGGASWTVDLTDRVSLRPMATLEHFRLWESGYAEDGGGDGMDLTVLKRASSATSATPSVTAAYRFGRKTPDGRPLTVELEGGYRQTLAGQLGTTSAYFTDGDTFAIAGGRLKGGWNAEARLLAGGWDFTWQLAGRAEQASDGKVSYSGRASLSVAF